MIWQYKTVRFTKKAFTSGALDQGVIDNTLNESGLEGWELVSLETHTGFWGNEVAAVAIFKRPLSET